MNVTKCLTVGGLIALVVAGISLISIFVLRRARPKEDGDESSSDESTPIKALDKKLGDTVDLQSKQVEETLDRMRKIIEEERVKTSEEIKRKQEEALASFRDHFKRPEIQLRKEVPTVDLVLDLDLNLPQSGSAQYLSGSNKVNVEKEPATSYASGPYVKYKHSRPQGLFNIEKVRFCGKEYGITPTKDVRYLITVSMEHDPGFIYFIFVVSQDVVLYENDGRKFVESTSKHEMYPAMLAMAKEFGRPLPDSLEDAQELQTSREAAPQYTSPREAPGPAFQLDLNYGRTIHSSSNTINHEKKTVYTDYFQRTYTPSKPLPLSFKVDGQEQSGLPTDKPLRSVTVYFSQSNMNNPLVLVLRGDETKFYLNANRNTWVEHPSTIPDQDLEGFLNYMDSMVNKNVVLNVSRRSDYYRNGSQKPGYELSKDVNVYVEVDKPFAGWNTFRHLLEVRTEDGQTTPVTFSIKKGVFGSKDCFITPMNNVKFVDAYAKSDDTTKPPAILFIEFSDGSSEYFMRAGSGYLESKNSTVKVTPENLLQRLKQIDEPSESSP